MGCIASFGNFDKKYFLKIIIISLSYIITSFPLMIYYSFKYTPNINTNQTQNFHIVFMVFLFFFGQSLCIFPHLISKCLSKTKKEKLSEDISKQNNSKYIEYIFNNPLDTHFTIKEVIILIIVCLLNLTYYFLKSFGILFKQYNYEYFNENHFFDYLMFLVISIYFFNLNYYKHQYCSIIILTLLGILKYITKIFIYNLFDIRYIIIELIFNFFIALFGSITFGYINLLIQKKFFSVFKSCYIFGMINIPIIIIIYFIATNISCSNFSIYCINEYEYKYYFDNIYSLFKGFGNDSIELILQLVFSLGFAFLMVINYNILDNYTIFHLILPWQAYEFISDILNCIDSNTNHLFIILIDIIEIIIIMIFLEFIELNFCKFNYNLQRVINKRAKSETDKILRGHESIDERESSTEEDQCN